MPNWCDNEWVISAKSVEQAKEIADLFTNDDKGFKHYDPITFTKLIPLPEGGWNCDWCCKNWGTKWDASQGSIDVSGEEVIMRFYTAWSPPGGVVRVFDEKYPDVSRTFFYREDGMQLAGYL